MQLQMIMSTYLRLKKETAVIIHDSLRLLPYFLERK